jgi:hypothetical protein
MPIAPQPFSAAPRSDDAWRRFTREGNGALEEGRIAAAEAAYAAAILEAEILLDTACDGDIAAGAPAPVLVNIAYHNAAELALRGGDGGRAIAFCRQAFERLLALVETDGVPAVLRRDSLAALRRAFLALGDMAERSGEGRDAAAACLARMQALVARPA